MSRQPGSFLDGEPDVEAGGQRRLAKAWEESFSDSPKLTIGDPEPGDEGAAMTGDGAREESVIFPVSDGCRVVLVHGCAVDLDGEESLMPEAVYRVEVLRDGEWTKIAVPGGPGDPYGAGPNEREREVEAFAEMLRIVTEEAATRVEFLENERDGPMTDEIVELEELVAKLRARLRTPHQERVRAWHRQHFGRLPTTQESRDKLREEVDELQEALSRAFKPAVRDELADVAIVCLGIAEILGDDLGALIAAKLDVIEARPMERIRRDDKPDSERTER